MTTIEIRSAVESDCAAIAAVHVDSWRAAYFGIFPDAYLESLSVSARQASWRKVLEQGNSKLRVAVVAEQVVGFVSFGPSRDNDATGDVGEIWALYLHPDSWSTGIGKALLQHAKRELIRSSCTDVTLWVLESNLRALRFYESSEFLRDNHPGISIERGGVAVLEIRLRGHLDAAGSH